MVCTSFATVAQQEGIQAKEPDKRAFSITPQLSVSESMTHTRPDGAGSRTEFITSIAPGLRVLSRAGRVQGSVDYALNTQYYSRSSGANGIHHQLAATVAAEAIPDYLFVDMNGSIGRQPISALGVQSATPSQAGKNYSDVKTFSVAPLLRGTLAGVVDVQARALASGTSTGTASASDSTHASAALHFGSIPSQARLGWAVDASHDVVDFDLGRRTEEDRVVAGLSVRVVPEFSFTVRGGTENSDVASLAKKRIRTYGGAILWTPTERTRISAEYDKRAFGNSHAYVFSHRMRRSVWRYSDTQALSTGANAGGLAVPAFDLFFALFKASEPDPVLREQQVDSFLQQNNLQRDQLLRGGFLTSGSAVERRQELSFAVEDIRTTYLLSAFSTTSERAFQLAGLDDDLQFGPLRQRGLTFLVSHRVSSTAGINLYASTQRTTSESILNPSGNLYTVLGAWNDKLSDRIGYSVSVRHSTYSNALTGYKELALIGGLNLKF